MYKAHFSLDVKGFNSDEEARDFLFNKLLHTLTWHEVIPYELLSIPWEVLHQRQSVARFC